MRIATGSERLTLSTWITLSALQLANSSSSNQSKSRQIPSKLSFVGHTQVKERTFTSMFVLHSPLFLLDVPETYCII